MKLTIDPVNGTITVDTPDNVSAAQFVRELLGGQKPATAPKAIDSKRVAKKRPARRTRKLAPPRADRPLTRVQDETWAWLAASDRREGVTPAEVAQAFGLTYGAAVWRLSELVKRDMAWRVKPGYYRVGSVADTEMVLNGTNN